MEQAPHDFDLDRPNHHKLATHVHEESSRGTKTGMKVMYFIGQRGLIGVLTLAVWIFLPCAS